MRLESNSARLITAIAALLFTAPAWAQGAPPATISVIGEATISTPPDLAQFEAGVSTEAKTAREASESNNSAMGKVLLALKSLGLEARDLQTSRLSLQPQMASNRPGASGPASIVSYRASNRVTIRVRDVNAIAKVIDTAVGAGANDIGGIEFRVANQSRHLDDAREQAIADARRKAEIYAKAAGVTLGAPISITEIGAPVPVQYRAMATTLPATPVAQGEQTLQITVNVSWAIKPTQ